MDKNTYETYEFLPANNNEAEHDQFFVVQDDGTFLLNRQIQYVAQVQDVKEVLEDVQPCTVYGVGVSSQQFFVDVTNSDELISVSDQFIMPDGDSGLYTSSYLLQPSSSTTTVTEQMKDVVDQFKQSNTQDVDIDVTTHNSKQGNNFTEITLSDEQYHTLEQKGWILLESNDKIFVLNTLGLHDITTNDKLIQKLKSEIQNDANMGIDAGTIKIENVTTQLPNLVTESFTNQQDTVEFVVGSNEEQDGTMENLQFVISDADKENTEEVIKTERQMYICTQESELQNNINDITPHAVESLPPKSSIKIKTKFNFKDIPEKIALGKTVNGKRLVAKVVRRVTNNKEYKAPTPDLTVSDCTVNAKVDETQEYNNNNGICESELIGLVQQHVRNGLQNKVTPDDVKSAESVIEQLLRVPNIKGLLVGNNVIISNVKNNKDEFGVVYNKSNIVLVTGCVKEKEDSSAVFEYLPNLLMTIKSSSEGLVTSGNQNLECIDHEKAICTLLHVHISETKSFDNVVRVSVTLNKRQLSINQMFYIKKRHPNTVYGCSACAALFKSEEALKEHQAKNCLDSDETLTIDTSKLDNADMVDAYSMIKAHTDKTYSCTQCNVKFTKLYSCIRHVKSHLGLNKKPKTKIIEKSNEQVNGHAKKSNQEVFKCKMCHSTYFHAATLSKHILARHIKVKAK